MSPKQLLLLIGVVIGIIFAIVIAVECPGSVDNGTYVIKQAAVSGDIQAFMKPGMFSRNFGATTVWPVSETFYFTKEPDHKGDTGDESVEVRFNDGAVCRISGTCRVDMPRSETEAIALITKHGYRTHEQVEQKLILPVIRRALIMTANLMSSKESYSDRRPDFFKFAWDQIANGVYQTKDEAVVEIDPITQEKVTRTRKTILVDKEGKTLRENNPLENTGITLSIFEIKDFGYDPAVTTQIAKQQESIMAVQIARAQAQKAVQDGITSKALGEAVVIKAEYEEKEKKIRAEVKANQEASVATIEAQKQLDVATKVKETALVAAAQERDVAAIALEAAALTKKTAIEKATGQAEAKRLILAADNALEQKLEAYNKANEVWAAAYAKRNVPQIVMGNGAAAGADLSEASKAMELMQLKAARDLLVDPTIKAAPSK